MQSMTDLIKEKNVLFITTKNIDYLRNTQEIRLIKDYSKSVDILYSEKKNNPLRILDVLGKIIRRKMNKYDVVFVGFEPQFVVPFVGKKFKNNTLIIDFFISVYDTLICDRKKFKDGGLVSKICRRMDIKTIKLADYVITDTRAHADFFIKEFGGEKERFETIYLEADSSIYYSREQKKTPEMKDKFTVLYFGSILPLQGVDVVLDAIRELNNRPEIYFDIIGPIPKQLNKPIQDNVSYTTWLSQEELAEHIAASDLCLAGHFCKDIEKAGRTIPGKAYIYEMMGKKMILGDGEANHELFKADENHYFVERGNAKNLAGLILEITEKNKN